MQKNIFLLIFLFSCLLSCDTTKQIADKNTKIRLITLSPHLAELVDSAGAINNLVGVVAHSDFPEKVKTIQQIGDAFKLDYETIITLNPDYILSWKGGTPIATLEKLRSLQLNIIETDIKSLVDIPKTIEQIAKLTNTENHASININKFNNLLNKFKGNNHIKKTIFIATYQQPLYTVSGDHWLSEAVAICGYENIFEDLRQLSTTVSLEAVINKNPKTILNIAKQPDQQWQKWQNLAAVKNNRIYTISPDFFSRPSMRILTGIAQLCERI